MKIVIAPDKFKGSLSSFEVCDAIEKGLRRASSSFEIIKLPLADGGDGLSEVIRYYTQATVQHVEVSNPLFHKISSSWLLSADKKTAFIEMAKASGLQLLQSSQYNPSLTSTYGTGELIKAAIESGIQQIILGIGGSATNDGGIGMATALGYKFLDEKGKELSPVGGNLIHIKNIRSENKVDLSAIEILVACDVKNLLFGDNGASKVYGPQKGADRQMVEELEEGMMNYAALIKKEIGIDVSTIEGGGAAGGLGAGCVAFLNAKLINGSALVMKYGNIEEHIAACDLLITGEGKIDTQTLEGKLVAATAAMGKQYNKKVIAVCGSKEISDQDLRHLGIEQVYAIIEQANTVERSMKEAAFFLSETGYEIAKNIL